MKGKGAVKNNERNSPVKKSIRIRKEKASPKPSADDVKRRSRELS